MKKHLIAQALLLLAVTAAHAQTPKAAPSAPAVADSNSAQFVKVDVAPAQGADVVNPFRGVPLGVEQLQRNLEVSKLQTQLLEEQLRNASLNADLKNIPTRKEAEISQSLTQVVREQVQRAQLERESRVHSREEEAVQEEAARVKRDAAAARKASERRAVEEEKRAVEQSRLTSKAPVAEAPVATRVEVLSVTTVGERRSALLAVNANIASVQDGDNTPLGKVSISREGVVSLNGVNQVMQQSSIARVKLSEPAVTAQTAGARGGAPGAAPGGATPPTLVIGSQPEMNMPTFVPPPVPGSQPVTVGTPKPNPVPQIQLPAGVTMVPKAR